VQLSFAKLLFLKIFFLVGLGFDLRALQSWCSTAESHLQSILFWVILEMGSWNYLPGLA
jgi:hypothetical protein